MGKSREIFTNQREIEVRINHELINKSVLARKIGMKPDTFINRLRNVHKESFTPKQLEKIRGVFEDMFCYIFDVDEIKF